MASNNRLFEDFARVAQGAAGALVGLRDELEARIKDQDAIDLILDAGFELVAHEPGAARGVRCGAGNGGQGAA